MYNYYNEVIKLKNKLIKEIKKNKYTSIAVVAFIALLLLLFIIYKAVMPSLGTPVYGNRLEGIEKVEITTNKMSELDKKLEKEKYVSSSKTNVSGKTVDVVVTVIEKTKPSDAKKITDVVLKEFDKDQVAYYDFQVFIKSENSKEKGYPIIAYKNKSNDKFSYSSASNK